MLQEQLWGTNDDSKSTNLVNLRLHDTFPAFACLQNQDERQKHDVLGREPKRSQSPVNGDGHNEEVFCQIEVRETRICDQNSE